MNTKRGIASQILHNPMSLFGLIIIALALITAVFAYYIAPDATPDANRMIPEIANKKPGFSMLFLQQKKAGTIKTVSFFNRLLYGQEDGCYFIPIDRYRTKGNNIYADKFVDDNIFIPALYKVNSLLPQPVIRKTFYLGTDKFGRDILSRLIVGVRVSLCVGLIAVGISLTLGIFLGALAGYFGGKTDNMITWFTNVIWSIPTLLLVFAITLAMGKGFWQVFIAVGLTLWVSVARLVRGQVMALSKLEYVEASKVLGFSHTRTIIHHILPNIIGPVMVIAAGNFASAIVIEAGLSFLGVGVQPPQPSWGLMIKENYNFIITHNPMLALAPGIAIMLLVLAFNLLGNGLRDAMDNRTDA